jgi:hypothetical protein
MGMTTKADLTVLEIARGQLAPSEKQEQAMGDRLMATYRFTSIHFAQVRASMQTPGIPDRKYYREDLGFTFWWEVKAEGGKQRPAQKKFQAMCERCGEFYVLGTAAQLGAWLAEKLPRLTQNAK